MYLIYSKSDQENQEQISQGYLPIRSCSNYDHFCSCKYDINRRHKRTCPIYYWTRTHPKFLEYKEWYESVDQDAYNLELHTRDRTSKNQRQAISSKFLRSIRRKHKGIKYLWVWHREEVDDVMHFYCKFNGVDKQFFFRTWKRIIKQELDITLLDGSYFCNEASFPASSIRYGMGRHPDSSPKYHPPWKDMDGRVYGRSH